MISIYICIAAIAVMLGISLKARKDFAPDERIPMQWDISGKANWSARCDIAIWIMPAIALLTLIFTLVIVVISQVSDDIIGYSVVGLTAVMFVIIHKGTLFMPVTG